MLMQITQEPHTENTGIDDPGNLVKKKKKKNRFVINMSHSSNLWWWDTGDKHQPSPSPWKHRKSVSVIVGRGFYFIGKFCVKCKLCGYAGSFRHGPFQLWPSLSGLPSTCSASFPSLSEPCIERANWINTSYIYHKWKTVTTWDSSREFWHLVAPDD